MVKKMDYKKLINTAIKYQKNAYAPYSKFLVGASVLCQNGKIFGGANIENASYPCGICAERVALSKAISEGENKFVAVAIVGDGKNYCYPCGLCRQFLSEFGNIKIIVANSVNDFVETDTKTLLPNSFDCNNLN